MVDVVNFFAILIFYFVIGFSLIGAALLCMGFQYAKVPGFDFFRCWKIYTAAILYCSMVICGIGLILPRPAEFNSGSQPSVLSLTLTFLSYISPLLPILLLS